MKPERGDKQTQRNELYKGRNKKEKKISRNCSQGEEVKGVVKGNQINSLKN